MTERRPLLLPPERWRQGLALVALVAGATYLGWRWGWTLRWETAWLGLPLLGRLEKRVPPRGPGRRPRPEEVSAFLTQRGRWASGCYQILRRDNPLWARGLTLRQRLHYFSSVSHYLEGPQRLIGILVPPLVLFTGTVPLAAPPVFYLALFLPQLVLVPLATWALARGRYRFSDGERFASSG